MNIEGKKLNLQALKKKIREWLNTSVAVSAFGKKAIVCPAKLLLAVVGALLVLILLIQLLLIPAHQPKSLDMDFETGGDYSMHPYEEGLLLYNKQNLRFMNHKGETIWSVKQPMSLPVVSYSGKYVLSADLGGNNVAILFKDGEKAQEFNLGKDIITAKVNKKGMVALATATDGYKGRVVVIDKKGKELFAWNSGDGHIMDVAINDNGRYLAVAQLASDGEVAGARIQFIDLYQKKVTNIAERPGSIIGEIKFSGNRLLSVSDTELCGFSKGGRLLYSISFAGKRPSKYDISSDDRLAFVTRDNRGNAVLEIYSTSGRLKGRYPAEGNIDSLSVHKDKIVIAGQRDVLQLSGRGRLRKEYICEHEVQSIGVFGNNKAVLVEGGAEADILWLK